MRLIFCLIIFYGTVQSYGQFSVKVAIVSPTGYLGAVLKKSPMLSIGMVDDFSGKRRTRWMGELTYFKPRKEAFDIYAYVIEGNTNTIFPGTQKINLYTNLSYSYGLDYGIVQKEKFNWYVGGDGVAGITLRQYTEDIPYVSSGSEFAGLPFIGLRGRTGVEQIFGKTCIFLDFSRTYYLNWEYSFFSYNDFSIGIRF